MIRQSNLDLAELEPFLQSPQFLDEVALLTQADVRPNHLVEGFPVVVEASYVDEKGWPMPSKVSGRIARDLAGKLTAEFPEDRYRIALRRLSSPKDKTVRATFTINHIP